MEHALEYITFYVQKYIAHLVVYFGPPLFCDGQLGAPEFVKIAHWRETEGSASVGYWVSHVTLTFDLTPDLELGVFKVTFRNTCISGIVGLIHVKRKRN